MILSLALRYSFSSKGRHRRRSMRTVLTIALSVAVVLSVMAIMDYLQEGRLERIRRVRSFDTVVSGDACAELRALYPDLSVFVYGETEALVSGKAMRIRFIDGSYDGGILMLSGDDSALVLSYPSMLSLDGKEASVMLLSRGRSGMMLPSSFLVPVSGVYTTEMGREFDTLHAFLPISMMEEGTDVYTAVRGRDVSEELRALGYDAVSWKEAESALYSAFMLEKTMMYLVLFLLFIIIAVSMKQTVRIFYRERCGEIFELMILGMERWRIRASFMLSFLMVLFIGLAAGLLLSYLVFPFLGSYLESVLHRGGELRVWYGGFAVIALFLFTVSMIFTSRSQKKAESIQPEEAGNNV